MNRVSDCPSSGHCARPENHNLRTDVTGRLPPLWSRINYGPLPQTRGRTVPKWGLITVLVPRQMLSW